MEMTTYYGVTRSDIYLEHHGIKGQKWGVRRFQNKDGTRTAAGKKHENEERAVLRGARKAFDKAYADSERDDQEYRKGLIDDDERDARWSALQKTLTNDPNFRKAIQPVLDECDAVWDKWKDLISEPGMAKNKRPEYNDYVNDRIRPANEVTNVCRRLGLVGSGMSADEEYERIDFMRTVTANYADEYYSSDRDRMLAQTNWIQHSEIFKMVYQNELYHHGIKGQKWGVRRFQNRDGSLTAAGKRRIGQAVSATADLVRKYTPTPESRAAKAAAKQERKERREAEKHQRDMESYITDPKKRLKNIDKLSDADLKRLSERLTLENKVTDLTREQLEKPKKMADMVLGYADTGINIAQKVVAGYDAFQDISAMISGTRVNGKNLTGDALVKHLAAKKKLAGEGDDDSSKDNNSGGKDNNSSKGKGAKTTPAGPSDEAKDDTGIYGGKPKGKKGKTGNDAEADKSQNGGDASNPRAGANLHEYDEPIGPPNPRAGANLHEYDEPIGPPKATRSEQRQAEKLDIARRGYENSALARAARSGKRAAVNTPNIKSAKVRLPEDKAVNLHDRADYLSKTKSYQDAARASMEKDEFGIGALRERNAARYANRNADASSTSGNASRSAESSRASLMNAVNTARANASAVPSKTFEYAKQYTMDSPDTRRSESIGRSAVDNLAAITRAASSANAAASKSTGASDLNNTLLNRNAGVIAGLHNR